MAENTGVKATEVLSKLYAAHQDGNKNIGVDIEVGANTIYAILSYYEHHFVATSELKTPQGKGYLPAAIPKLHGVSFHHIQCYSCHKIIHLVHT